MTPRQDHNQEMLNILKQLPQDASRPRLLLHSCCAPCSSSVLERLVPYFHVLLHWFNPNIFPEVEFLRRLDAQKKLLSAMALTEQVELLVSPWQNERYMAQIRGLENEPEKGARCTQCFRLRLEEAAKVANELHCEFFCSTLTLSRHKNSKLINQLGQEMAEKYHVTWLPSEFRKQNGEKRTSELCSLYNIYRQNYCGCQFSIRMNPPPTPPCNASFSS